MPLVTHAHNCRCYLWLARVGGVSCVACSATKHMECVTIECPPGAFVVLPSRVPYQLWVPAKTKVFRPQNCLASSQQTHNAVSFSSITLIIVFLSSQIMWSFRPQAVAIAPVGLCCPVCFFFRCPCSWCAPSTRPCRKRFMPWQATPAKQTGRWTGGRWKRLRRCWAGLTCTNT